MTAPQAAPAASTPPPGRYGRTPTPGDRRRSVVLLWALGAAAVAVAVWLGLGAAQMPVTWKDVGFTLADGRVDVVYDVIRTDPSLAVQCRLEALNQAHAQVGVLVVDVAAGADRVTRLRSTVAVAEPAVPGVVESCWVS